MKIVDLKTFVVGAAWRNLTFIRLDTDEGVSGYAEATVHNKTKSLLGYMEEAKSRYVIGSDPFDTESLFARMFRLDYGWAGGVQATVISAVEIACWDIVGKALGQPVWRLIGGKCRETIPAYANGWYTGDRTPESFAARAREVAAMGYRGLKLDPFGGGGLELAREERLRAIGLVEAVRDAVGPSVELFIEAHGRFSPATSITMARQLERFEPSWYEEPVPPENVDALLYVKERIGIPVATGERAYTRYGFRELIEKRAADILQPDVIHAGGFTEVRKIAAMAEPHYMTMAPHNSSGPMCTAASVHLAAALPNFKIQETFDDFAEPWLRDLIPGSPVLENGCFRLPSAPGLGVEFQEELVGEHPPRDGFFNLWDPDWHKRNICERKS